MAASRATVAKTHRLMASQLKSEYFSSLKRQRVYRHASSSVRMCLDTNANMPAVMM